MKILKNRWSKESVKDVYHTKIPIMELCNVFLVTIEFWTKPIGYLVFFFRIITVWYINEEDVNSIIKKVVRIAVLVKNNEVDDSKLRIVKRLRSRVVWIIMFHQSIFLKIWRWVVSQSFVKPPAYFVKVILMNAKSILL